MLHLLICTYLNSSPIALLAHHHTRYVDINNVFDSTFVFWHFFTYLLCLLGLPLVLVELIT